MNDDKRFRACLPVMERSLAPELRLNMPRALFARETTA